MMKPIRVSLAILLLVLALVFVGGGAAGVDVKVAEAQGQGGTAAPGAWQSAINLQNTTSLTATVTISFYQSDGTPANVPSYSPSPIAPNGSVVVYLPVQLSGLTPGQYSAVVSSDQPLVSTVNTGSTNSATVPWTIYAYEGADASRAGSPIYFPGLYNSYYNFFSEMVIQNAGGSTATLSATFYDLNGVQIATGSLGTLAPNAAKTYPMATLATTPPLPSGTIPGSAGIFSAVVSSTGSIPLVGVANIWRTTPYAGTASYNAYTSGTTTLYAPGLYNTYYGFQSALSVQNVHTSQNANILVTYSNGVTETANLLPGASIAYFQPNNPNLPSGNALGIFSARVSATGGSIVGLVSVSRLTGGDFASYNTPLTATTQINVPSVLSDYYGYFTGITVQNTGNTTATISIAYPGSYASANRSFPNVPPNGTVAIVHLDNTGDTLPSVTATSAIISSSPAVPIVAVLNHNTASNVVGYNPAKLPSDFLLSTTGVPK